MEIIDIPRVVWLDVLNNWLGNLREIIRVDLAFANLESSPLLEFYADKAFRLTDDRNNFGNRKIMMKLNSWVQLRKVYVGRLAFGRNSLLSSQFDNILAWSCKSILHLSIPFGNECPKLICSWASDQLNHLQHLRVECKSHIGPDDLAPLLHNNAGTLVSVMIGTDANRHAMHGTPTATMYPRLQILSGSYFEPNYLSTFLRGCPSLLALKAYGGTHVYGAVMAALATHCPLLQRLHLGSAYGLAAEMLLQVGHGCPFLQYLAMCGKSDFEVERLPDIVRALPQLRTLVMEELVVPVATLLAIAARGHRSLQRLDTYTHWTRDGLRKFTSDFPQLTGLAIRHLAVGSESLNGDLLQHCCNLEVLLWGAMNTNHSLAVHTVLEGAASYCPNMHTVILFDYMLYDGNKLSAFLARCPQLRTLRVEKYYQKVALPAGRNNLVITHAPMEMEEWIPVWAK